jgi:8-oxo-dGTP pyrophosphatase MutT (NUDIX family)
MFAPAYALHPKKSRQMYKIYVNGRLLILLSEQELLDKQICTNKTTLVSVFIGKKKVFRQHVDLLMKSPDIVEVYIWSKDLQAMWQEFTESFTLIVAAGGFVTNQLNEALVFLRQGVWDLPKGKIDPGEIPTEAALREVQEECGLQELVLGDFLQHTYHMYQTTRKTVLKKTWWYRMTSSETVLIPQVEEGIEFVQWEAKPRVINRIKDFYPNLHDVILLGCTDA